MAAEMEKTCNSCGRVFKEEKDYLQDTSRWRICSQGHLWFECSCQSTLMIPKGKFSWYSPEKFLNPEARSVFNRLGGLKDLPHIPHEIMQLQSMAQNHEIEIATLAQAVKKEPFIAKQILNIAQNMRDARAPSSKPLDSVEHAISYVGRKTLQEILAHAALHSFALKTKVFNADEFWKHSQLCGQLAEFLDSQLGFQFNPDELYMAACLTNLGKIVGAICLPKEIDEITLFIKNNKILTHWIDGEQELNATPHTVLGQIGAIMWGFPDYVRDGASLHHNDIHCGSQMVLSRPPDFFRLIALANQLAHWVNLEPQRIDHELLQKYLSYFNKTEEDIEHLIRQFNQKKFV